MDHEHYVMFYSTFFLKTDYEDDFDIKPASAKTVEGKHLFNFPFFLEMS